MDKKPVLGYLVVDEQDGVFEGAVLVTDTRGMPLDFRYTEPVRPTKLERILYGSALDLYLREDVILKNLMESVEAKPTIWLVKDSDTLVSVQGRAKVPAVLIAMSNVPPMDNTGQLEPTAELGTFHLQADAVSSPIRFSVMESKLQESQKIADSLVTAASEMELMEPFQRMRKALDSLSESR